MRILVLSLLRIGDVFMHLQVIQGIRQKFPNAEICIAINDDFTQLKSILENEQMRVEFFPRKKIQQLINLRTSHLLEPRWDLEEWIANLNGYQFDQIYNLTHTRQSALIAGSLKATKKFGIVVESDRVQFHGTQWLSYLNDHFASGQTSDFHLVEVLCRAFDLPFEINKFQKRESKRIYLQPLTSDLKKNWSLSHWKKLYMTLRSQLPNYQVSVLAAPNELAQLMNYFPQESIAVYSFVEMKQALEKAELLISGDTSAAHLASLVQTKTLMLSLGSSDPAKTGPFLRGSAVLAGDSNCRPCNHTQTCSQVSQLCADGLTASIVTHYSLGLLAAEPIEANCFPFVRFLSVDLQSQESFKLLPGGTNGSKDRATSRASIAEFGKGLPANSADAGLQ